MTDNQELYAARKRKLLHIRERGENAYPYGFKYTHRLADVHRHFAAMAAAGEPGSLAAAESVSVCGRLVSWRDHGKSVFAHLEDSTARLQIYLRKDDMGESAFALLADLDIGDFAGVTGAVMRTRTGELTVKASAVTLLAKSLRPLPEKWHGLKDVDTRYRNRHMDLAANPQAREIFLARARVIQLTRDFLNARGYTEVETPVLQPLYGGAEAEPFTTYYASLKTTYYLRISNELYLKRLLVGGMDRVYEFSKDFRNEGLDRMHTPEFTLLELYEAYADYEDMMRLTEDLMRTLVKSLKGEPVLTYQGKRIDFSGPWQRIPFVRALGEKAGFDPLEGGVERLRQAAEAARIPDAGRLSRPKLLDKLFGALVQPHLDGPVFVIDHPLELSPLAKAHRHDPRLAERFEPVIAGLETGNAFSELNDPEEQRRRFEEQQTLKRQGDADTQVMDEDFVAALELGMPPAGGLGLGIDRLVMILCDLTSIREAILFPQLKPEGARPEGQADG